MALIRTDSPLVTVQDRETWIRQDIAERRQVSRNLIVAILGLATLYIVIAVINAVVIAGADRREELATARLTGLSRSDVIRASVWSPSPSQRSALPSAALQPLPPSSVSPPASPMSSERTSSRSRGS